MRTIRLILLLAASATLFAACGGSSRQKTSGPAISSARADGSPVLSTETGPAPEIDTEVPIIRFISKGSILPTSGSLDLLFGSVSYAQAQVRVKKVFSSNILQFLQLESYETRYELYKIAEVVADTTLVLGEKAAGHLREWKTYGLSLDELIHPDPGAIYHVEIRGREPLVEEEPYWDSDDSFGDYNTYQERSVDLLASNLVLIAKRGDTDTEVFVYDVLKGKPVSGARVKLYSFAQQELAKGQSDGEGQVSFQGQPEGRFVVATRGNQYAYLDLKNEKALSTSNFDVSGTTHPGGIKAYIFGERGVWRPGDTLHVSVVTLFDGAPLPAGHPVTAQLRNPDGQLVQTLSTRSDGENLFHFPFTTEPDAPSGRWRVDVNVGGQTVSKTLRIETIKPNKLDIQLHFPQGYVSAYASEHSRFDLSVAWLYGAPGSALKVNGDVEISAAETRFPAWEGYDFQDDARVFKTQTLAYDDFQTGPDGKSVIDTQVDINKASAPGLLTAGYTFRAFEPGGDFSTSYASIRMSPFSRYVGIKTELKKDEWGERYIQAGNEQRFDVATVDAEGKGTSVSGLHAEVYHVDWSWWWDASGQIAGYMAGKSKELLFEKTFSTHSGKGSFAYDWADAPSGLYYIRVTDPAEGHATSMLCEVNTHDATDASEASTQLNMLIDKEKYTVGETARITIPSAEGACALVSIEKGGRILSTRRVPCFEGSTQINIPVTRDMTPNAYASIALIQPHGNVHNDAPIRLYGVKNISVEDPASHLQPVIDIPAETKPESTLRFQVKEKEGRAMSYVVALVDEGLLSLTSFKTPDAWSAFYAKEALRVRTWDEYDAVIGAYGGHIEQLFAIGGDDEASGALKRQGADRFKPVVAYLGPFTLKAGKTASHSIQVPQYIGSLRAMVVATDGKAQGSAAKNVSVTQPVMVQATLPRSLSVGETIRVPATLLALRDGVGKVTLDIHTDGPLSVQGKSSLETRINRAGQQVEYFEVRVGEQTGIAHVTVTARAGGDKSVSRVELDVFNPNPSVTRTQSFLVDAGQNRDVSAELFGLPGTNSVSVELSAIPAIGLKRRLGDLLEYPYGCVEQTISTAFPQLYLSQLTDSDETVAKRSARNVTATIARLHSFRRADGSLTYWPGSTTSSPFGTAYALHFLQEAENQGYAVPAELKAGLISYLSGRVVGNKQQEPFVRAYALYALAAAGKPQRSAMNLLREQAKKLPNSAVWMLAGAFASDGKKQVATSLTSGLPYLETDRNGYAVYGSEDRNLAIALRTSILTDQQESAFELAEKVAARLSDGQHYMSTQATAWSLYAICDFARSRAGSGISATVKGPEKTARLSTAKAIVRQEVSLDPDAAGQTSLNIANTGSATLHAVVAVSGTPKAGEERALESGLKMTVRYVDLNGQPVDVASLKRGVQFKAVVTVTNTGSDAVRDLALAQKFPSGWEIRNDRVGRENFSYPAGVTYQDFRDDRVYSFFDLRAGQSVTVATGLTATYPGRFYLPAVRCEAMYDAKTTVLIPGRWTEVK